MHGLLAQWAPAEEKSKLASIVYAGKYTLKTNYTTWIPQKCKSDLPRSCCGLLFNGGYGYCKTHRCPIWNCCHDDSKRILDSRQCLGGMASSILCNWRSHYSLVYLVVVLRLRHSSWSSQDLNGRIELHWKIHRKPVIQGYLTYLTIPLCIEHVIVA